MEFTVYRTRDGLIILVPECFLPPLACQHLYGPLARRGSVTVADAQCANSWRNVQQEIDVRSFAVLDRSEAASLLGRGHALLRSRAAEERIAIHDQEAHAE